MKREVKVLKAKSLDSLVLAIEHFNRPVEIGRVEAVLILLDRAFELLLKASIVHLGGKIREPRESETIGFGKCVRKCISNESIKCLSEEQAITLQIINSLRDAAQHYILDLSEQELYTYCQAGVTLYGDLLRSVFDERLRDHLPERVLPVSSSPPRDLHAIIDTDFKEVKALVRPGSRKRLDAIAKLRAIAIVEQSLNGKRSQPGELEMQKLVRQVQEGRGWRSLFPSVAKLNLATEGTGLRVSVRLTKRDGDPVHLVPEGTPGATVVAVKRVDELGFYCHGAEDLAKKVGLTRPRAVALVQHLGLQKNEKYYKEVRVGNSRFKRYSKLAVDRILEVLPRIDMEEVWEKHRPRRRR